MGSVPPACAAGGGAGTARGSTCPPRTTFRAIGPAGPRAPRWHVAHGVAGDGRGQRGQRARPATALPRHSGCTRAWSPWGFPPRGLLKLVGFAGLLLAIISRCVKRA